MSLNTVDYIKENKEKFKIALETGNKDLFKTLPKSDLHIHSTRGCNRNVFEKMYNCTFPEVPRFKSLQEMDDWYNKNIDSYAKDFSGYMIRMRELIKGFKEENVTVAAPIYCLKMAKYFENDIEKYLNNLVTMFKQYAPETLILPEFEVCRGEDPDEVLKKLEEVEKYKFYKSIDIRGDETLGIKQYSEVYKKAKEMGLILKAHAGEFTDVSSIDEAIEYLDLDCITHGLSLIESNELMKYVSDNEIMVNCCPSSNYLLYRVKSYEKHPIKEFLRNGIICTINTDDELIFNNTINDEYFNLYNSGCLTAEELYEINQNGITKCLNKRRR